MSNGLNAPRKGWFWRVLGSAAAGFMIGGFAGAVLGAAGRAAKEFDLQWRPTNVEAELSYWTERVFQPFFEEILDDLKNIESLTVANINKYNSVLEQLYAYKAYFEYHAMREVGDDKMIAQEKAEAIGEFIALFQTTWLDFFPLGTHNFNFVERSFDAIKYNRIGDERLDWQGARSVIAMRYVFSTTTAGDGVITMNPGNPSNPGTGTITGGGGSTGSGTTTGGGTNIGGNPDPIPGGGKIDVPTDPKDPSFPDPPVYPTAPETPETPETPEKKKSKWLVFAAIIAGILILK